MHTKSGIAERFVCDVQTTVDELMKNPEKPVDGKMALYGVSQTIPDRSIVGDFTRLFLDSLYFTPKNPKMFKKVDNQADKTSNHNESNDITLLNE